MREEIFAFAMKLIFDGVLEITEKIKKVRLSQ